RLGRRIGSYVGRPTRPPDHLAPGIHASRLIPGGLPPLNPPPAAPSPVETRPDHPLIRTGCNRHWPPPWQTAESPHNRLTPATPAPAETAPRAATRYGTAPARTAACAEESSQRPPAPRCWR